MTVDQPRHRLRLSHRRLRRVLPVLVTLAAVGVAAVLAHGVTFGSFDDPATVGPGVSMARISLSLTTPGGPPVPFQGTEFYPGSVVRQDVALSNSGGYPLASVRLVTSAGTPNLLTTDPVNGLQLTLTSCLSRWDQNRSGDYSCGNSPTLAYRGPYLADQTLPALGNLSVQTHILIEVTLPATAGNGFQGLSTPLGLEFRAQQAPGRVR